jgi:hypothetical protein
MEAIEMVVLRKNSILIALDIAAPGSDNRQEPSPIPRRETFTMTRCTRLLGRLPRPCER